MSDVGLGANLELDITAALRRVDQLGKALDQASSVVIQVDTSRVAPEITAAVDAADTGVLVQPDTTGVAPEITAAVDAADTGVLVTAEAADVTGSIDAAVDDADTGVVVTGDATSVTGAIDAAVSNADTVVTISADDQASGDIAQVTSRLEGLSRSDQTLVLRANIKQAEQSISQIVRQLGDDSLSNAEVRVLVDQRGEATKRIATIQGQIDRLDQESIDISGRVDPAISQSVDSVGDSLDAAATSGISLKSILTGLGAGAAVAGLRQLADAASDLQESTSKAQVVFGAQFGEIEQFAKDAAQATGLSEQAALEATATFGNLFQALGSTRAEAAAMSPTVVQLAGDLASFNNIGTDEALEKLRSGLVGEIEPLRQLGVSFNAVDVEAKALELGLGGVGRELTEGEKVQARLAIIMAQTSLAQGDFARTSEGLANQQRILSAELGNAAAAAGTLLLPAFMAILDEVRDAIPGLSQLGENVLPALGEALVALAPLLGTSVDLLVALSPIVQVVATGIGLIPGPVIQVAGALLLLNKALAVTNALAGATALGGLGAKLAAAAVPAGALSGAFTGAAVGSTKLAGGLSGLAGALKSPTVALAAVTGAVVLYNDMMNDAKQQGVDFGTSLRASFDPATASLDELRAASADLDTKIASLSADVDDSFLGRNGVNRDFNAALREGISQAEAFQVEIDAAAAALVRAAAEAEFGPLIAQLTNTGDALDRLGEGAPEVQDAIAALRSGGVEPTDRSLLSLAGTIDGATLSEEQMADAAALLGTDVASLQAFVDLATESLQSFADTAIGALPTVADAFKNVGDDSILSVAEFRKSLDDEANDMRAFTLRLAALTEAGFGDIAGVIAQQGPEIGGHLIEELVNSMAGGNTVLLEQTRASLDNFNGAWTDTTTYLRDVLGPEFVLTTGLIGSAASTTFGDNLSFDERLRIAGEVASLEMDAQGKAIAAIAATEGASAATRYGRALGLDDEVIRASVEAGVAIGTNAPTGPALAAGSSVGTAYGDGVIAGMNQRQQRINDKAAQLAVQAAHYATGPNGLDAGSPSRLTAKLLGIPFVEGIIAGMDQEAASVIAAAEAIVRDAAGVGVAQPISAEQIASVAPEVSLAAAGAGSANTGAATGDVHFTFEVTVNPHAGMTVAEAREVGAGVIDGAEERIAERRLSILGRTV